MANEIANFDLANVPAYLRATAPAPMLGAMFQSRAFNRVSIAGNVFSLVTADGEKMMPLGVMNGTYVQSPYLDLVFVKWSPVVNKQWYAQAYAEDTNAAPDCFSHDGVRPDASSPALQAESCAACPHNAFGSSANGKGKACSDSQRTAITLAADLMVGIQTATGGAAQPLKAFDTVWGYKIAPMTGKNLAARIAPLVKAGIDSSLVVMRATFVSQGVVDFQVIGWVPQELAPRIPQLAASDDAVRACGEDQVAVPALPAPAPVQQIAAPIAPPAPVYQQLAPQKLAPQTPTPMVVPPAPPGFAPQPMQVPTVDGKPPRKPRGPNKPKNVEQIIVMPAGMTPTPGGITPVPGFAPSAAPQTQAGAVPGAFDIPTFLKRDAAPIAPVVPNTAAIQQPVAANAQLEVLLDQAGFGNT